MGVRIPCYIADISKSVVGIGFLTQEYNFDVLFSGKYMHIYSQLSGETTSIIANNRYLFPMPETLFQAPKINVMMTCLSADSLVSLWHHRLAHISDRKLAYMAKQQEYRARGLILPESQANRVHLEEFCDCCMRAKGHRVRSHSPVNKDDSEVGLDWHVDLLGRQDVPGLVTGNFTFILYTDRKSRKKFGFGIADNTEEEILLAVNRWNTQCLAKVRAWYKDKYHIIHISLLSDNLEFKYPRVQAALSGIGVQQYYTAPRHSSSNGVSERGFGVLRPMARSMMTARDLPEEFWEAAMNHAVFISNRIPFMYRGSYQVDPYQIWTGKVFDYSKIRIFGSRCYVWDWKGKKDFADRSFIGIYVGHSPNSNAYEVYIPEINEFVSTEDIRFQEKAVDVFEAQRTPTEVQDLSEAFRRIGNFLATEMSLNFQQ
jgi:hypothetical protein